MKRSIRLARILTTRRNHFLDIAVSYDLGGMNYWTSNVDPRGYFISVTPCESDGHMTCMTAFTGLRHCIQPATRFSEKVLKQLSTTVKTHPILRVLVDGVLKKNKDVIFLPVVGQRVFWTDPDREQPCSGYGVIKAVQTIPEADREPNDPLVEDDAVIELDKEDGGYLECLPKELAPDWLALTKTN